MNYAKQLARFHKQQNVKPQQFLKPIIAHTSQPEKSKMKKPEHTTLSNTARKT
jgi:hypothetical protein